MQQERNPSSERLDRRLAELEHRVRTLGVENRSLRRRMASLAVVGVVAVTVAMTHREERPAVLRAVRIEADEIFAKKEFRLYRGPQTRVRLAFTDDGSGGMWVYDASGHPRVAVVSRAGSRAGVFAFDNSGLMRAELSARPGGTSRFLLRDSTGKPEFTTPALKKAGLADWQLVDLAWLVQFYQTYARKLPASFEEIVESRRVPQAGPFWYAGAPVDPWGSKYEVAPGPVAGSFVVRSAGPDGKLGTDDDRSVSGPEDLAPFSLSKLREE